jgi:hypothetical protein
MSNSSDIADASIELDRIKRAVARIKEDIELLEKYINLADSNLLNRTERD